MVTLWNFVKVLNNAYENGVPNEVLLDFLSNPVAQSSSSVKRLSMFTVHLLGFSYWKSSVSLRPIFLQRKILCARLKIVLN